MKITLYPTEVSYTVQEGKPIVRLYGRTTEGEQICVLDKKFEPYFVLVGEVKGEELLALRQLDYFVTRIERGSKKVNEKEKDVIFVYVNLPKGVPAIKNLAKQLQGVENVYEYNILYPRRYLLDKEIVPFTTVEVEGEEVASESKIKTIEASKITSSQAETLSTPKMLAIDIETYNPSGHGVDMKKNPIIMIAVYGKDFTRVVTWKRFKTDEDYIEFVETEADMIQRFVELVNEYGPDLILGYFTDGFDFPYLVQRAKMLKVKLDLGLDNSEVQIRSRIYSEARIEGMAHVDVFRFIRRVVGQTMQTDVFTLDAVSKELLGEQKHPVNMDQLYKHWDEQSDDLNEYAIYNLKDTELTYKLGEKILPNLIELVKIVQLPIHDISRMSFSQYVECFLMNQAHKANEVILNKPGRREEIARISDRVKGGFVYEPKPGLYENIVVLDYASLYPTIISSHNISKGTLQCKCCEGAPSIETDRGKLWFCQKRKGFFSKIISELILKRAEIKKEMKTNKDPLLAARSNALKLLANSFYGYMGFAPARWYCIECSESTTAWARHYIMQAMEKAKEKGFSVIYGDSLPYNRPIFVQTPNDDIKIITIGDLHKKFEKGYKTLAYTKNGQVKFKPIKKVIKHPYRGKLLEITTKYGKTVVTNQHSVYTHKNGLKLVDAETLKEGDYLISLTNPQIPEKYKKGHIFDILDLNMDHYQNELILYKDVLEFPAKKAKCPYCKKIACLSSHVNTHHKERKQPITKDSPYQFVGGKHAKTGKIPRYWKLDNDLAWLLGYYCADGSVSDAKTKTGRKYLLSFGSQNKHLIQKVKRIIECRIQANLRIIKNYDGRNKKHMYYYRVQRLPLVPLFQYGFGAGKGSEFKEVPFFIFNSEQSLRKAFLKGYLDGDSNQNTEKKYVTKFNQFSTKSKTLAIGLQFLFKSLDNGHHSRGRKIEHVYWLYRKDKPKIVKLQVQSAKHSRENYCLSEIKTIKTAPKQKYVYDLEVSESHNFVDAEGMILVHNTDSVFLKLDGKKIEDAMSFVEEVNKELPSLMELEFEGHYPAGLFVSTKASEEGAKKKYALIDDSGRLQIKGFETVRRNWSFIAKETQKKVLEIVLKDKDVEKARAYVREVVKDLRANKIPTDKLVIRTKLTKDIDEYAAMGPHVAAAKLMKEKGMIVGPGSIIYYVIVQGKGRIRDKVGLLDDVGQDEYDGEYYVKHHILPGVERIFAVFGMDMDDLSGETRQSSLINF